MTATPHPAAKERHPWSRGRRSVLAGELDRLSLPAGARILDAGCGAGLMLEELAPRGTVSAVDADAEAVAAARARGLADVHEAPVESLPFDDAQFDLVCSFDVLEHTDDDSVALRELRRVARPAAKLLVAVPALPSLWSGHDVAAGHRRRYRRRELVSAAAGAGWDVERIASFNTILLPVAASMRLVARMRDEPPRSDLLRAPRAAAPLEAALRLEARAMKAGVKLPVGLSLVATFGRRG